MCDRWWLNIKVNGKGGFLHDLTAPNAFDVNLSDRHPDVVQALFKKGVDDARGDFPPYILAMVEQQADAPGCSALVPR